MDKGVTVMSAKQLANGTHPTSMALSSWQSEICAFREAVTAELETVICSLEHFKSSRDVGDSQGAELNAPVQVYPPSERATPLTSARDKTSDGPHPWACGRAETADRLSKLKQQLLRKLGDADKEAL
jgi:hypothetical protein